MANEPDADYGPTDKNEYYVRVFYGKDDVSWTAALAVPADDRKTAERLAVEKLVAEGHVEEGQNVTFSNVNQSGEHAGPIKNTYLRGAIYNELPRLVEQS